MKELIAVIVLYFPNYDEVENNISKFIEDVDLLVCWDNTPIDKLDAGKLKSHKEFKERIFNRWKGKIIHAGTTHNEYLPLAYNSTLKYAIDNGFANIMFMDQDSEWENFSEYKAQVLNRMVVSRGIYGIRTNESCADNFKEVNCVINSGMIVPSDLLLKIGGFHSDFKLDFSDIELCIRALSKGIKVYKVSNIGGIKHQLGNLGRRSFLGMQFQSFNYSPFRLHEIQKCAILMKKLHCHDDVKYDISWVWKVFLCKEILKIILVENQKCKKLWAMVTGIASGVMSRKLHSDVKTIDIQ